MKSIIALLLGFVIAGCARTDESPSPIEKTHSFVNQQIDSLGILVNQLERDVLDGQNQQAQINFRRSRLVYKKIEALTEFYFAETSQALNGPAIDKPEEYDDKIIEAMGFQVVEELLFPEVDGDVVSELITEVRILKSCVTRLKALCASNSFSEPNVFLAVRLEMLRIMSLGISGFDSPVAFHSLREAAAALTGAEQILSFFKKGYNEQNWDQLRQQFRAARAYLVQHDDFDRFDRAEFITQHINPLTRTIYSFQESTGVPTPRFVEAIQPTANDFSEQGIFNVGFFSPDINQQVSGEMVSLGEILFFDPILSGNNSRACASCHQPEKAFTDGREKSISFNATGRVMRNAPTLINAAYQRSLFWDQRIQFLEDQVTEVVNNPEEMHGRLDESIGIIRASDEYQILFERAFGAGDQIRDATIRQAIAAYIRSLESFNSRFDQFLRGDKTAVSERELNGFNLFMGKAKCGTCHFTPLFNGTVPPLYSETESEVLGVPSKPDTVNAIVDPDLGKYFTYNRELHKHAFKTPTLRNVAITAPYMHNGVYETLEEVLDFYNRGGGEGIGISLPNQTLPPDPLNLSKSEQQNIIAFLHALTDTIGLNRRPPRLPLLKDRALSDRRPGGTY